MSPIKTDDLHQKMIFPVSISLLYIGASETIFVIRATFADKCCPSIPIPPGNINPVRVVSKQVAFSHPTKLVAACATIPKTLILVDVPYLPAVSTY